MARSKKKTPIVGNTTAKSEKEDKVAAHRRERRIVRTKLPAHPEVLPAAKEVSDPWSYAKDGKHYAGLLKSTRPSADPKYRAKLLRK